MSMHLPLRVKVWGEYACFTRPEMKVERVSYPVMTPSAARGVLEAIYWKPEFQWRVRRIHVLKPIRHASILRNEVNSLASERAARSWASGDGGGYFADEDRTQRHTLALRDVAYLLEADVVPTGRGAADDPAKHRDIFRRRVASGACFHRPYLGCREFAACFAEPDGSEQPIDLTDDLGRMLFDLRWEPTDTRSARLSYYRHEGDRRIETKGRAVPVFFRSLLDRGVLHVPPELYERPEVAVP